MSNKRFKVIHRTEQEDIVFEAKMALKHQCVHEIIKNERSNGAICKNLRCNEYFGWYCPDSPDHLCHYCADQDEKGYFVKLVNGERCNLLNYTIKDKNNESNDWCIFCGHPEERN